MHLNWLGFLNPATGDAADHVRRQVFGRGRESWAGGSIPVTPDGPTIAGENKDAVTIEAGAPVTLHSSGVGFILADAATAGYECVGLSLTAVAPTFSATAQTNGPLTLADWTAVTGGASLTPRAPYFLSATSGLLTATPPTTTGHYVQEVGVAVAADTLVIQIEPPILL